jgi:putative serine/threonine protein kinase
VEDLDLPPYVRVLCYPSGSSSKAEIRVATLKEMGVEALDFVGRTEISGVRVLGKGHVGVVVRCVWRGREAALKIRRTDSDREGLEREGEILEEANRWGLGPILYGVSRDFIVMEELVGMRLIDWLEGSKELPEDDLRRVLSNICRQARLLDVAGIDHKELSDPRRHVIVQDDGSARLLDFETAGTGGRMRNVSNLLQFLTISGPYGAMVLSRLGGSRDEVLDALKAYRREPSEESYGLILKAMNLA